MHFEPGIVYHIYNQGNNRQKLFFNRDNYLFFLQKIRTQLTPHADLLAWCLMPNHFHIMVLAKDSASTRSATLSRAPRSNNHQMTQSHQMSCADPLTKSIAIMLRSYTRAINKQQNTSGNLFRQKTKAIPLNQIHGITPAYFNTQFGTKINATTPQEEYLNICFNYIHNNPVKAQLVRHATDWEFSSAQDYAGLRNGTLIQKQKAREVGLVW